MALMPMVIKFGSSDWGTLYEQFCDVFQLTGDIAEKLIEGQWQRLVTLMIFWSHISFTPNDCQVPILCGNHFILSLFCTGSGEGFLFLCEIENVYQLIAHYRANGLTKMNYSKMGPEMQMMPATSLN